MGLKGLLQTLSLFWYMIAQSEARCRRSIFHHNGVEILLGDSLYDQVVVLYLMKRKCEKRCFDQLMGLNNLARQFEKMGEKVTFVAVKPNRAPSLDHFKPFLPKVEIYTEPRTYRFMRLLRAQWKEIYIYGRCGMERFYYGDPTSSVSNPFIKYAIQYTLYYPDECEPC